MGVILVILAAAAAAWVLAPLRDTLPAPGGEEPRFDERRGQLRAARDATEQTLRDLDLDHATGKVTSDDYTLLRTACEARLAALERRLEELPGPAGTVEGSRTMRASRTAGGRTV